MTLVVRANYSQETMLLLAYMSCLPDFKSFENLYVVTIETGWAGEGWYEQVERGEQFARQLGYTPIRLVAHPSFEGLIRDRGDFPSQKFQWCAGMLKGIPLINWLDEHDPHAEWVIAIPKRQVLSRVVIPDSIEACPYHGDRKVIYPILKLSDQHKIQWLARYGMADFSPRGLECEPCVNLQLSDIATVKISDIEKTVQLENSIKKNLYVKNIKAQVSFSKQNQELQSFQRDSFNRGCGDLFGCGL